MQDRSELHIIAPGICGPLAEIQSLKSSQVIDRWVKTLSKSSSLPSLANTNDVLASVLNINVESDFPSAAYTLLANEKYDPDMFYMHADPVFLRADLDSAVLTSSNDLNISDEESQVLCETLNQHFNQDGLTFFLLNKNQWFVSCKNRVSMRTTSLGDATGRNINFILPEGEDASRWKQILTEAQMLMHSHPINTARENAGQQMINSLWFHGSGELTDITNSRLVDLCSNHDMIKGIASHAKCRFLKVPDSVDDYADYLLSCEQGSVNVLHLTELEHLVNYTDVRPWLNQLSETLGSWVYPLLNIAGKNNIKVTLYACNEKEYQFSNYDILKFWRKGKLEEYVCSY